MVRKWSKIVRKRTGNFKNGPKWSGSGPRWSRKVQEMSGNGQKMPKNGVKCPGNCAIVQYCSR